MKRTIALFGLAALLSVAPAVLGADNHVKATLVPIGGSGVSGFVQLTQLPHGGTNIHVVVSGLQPGAGAAATLPNCHRHYGVQISLAWPTYRRSFPRRISPQRHLAQAQRQGRLPVC